MYKDMRFADCDIDDPFFDSLKDDYPEFCSWFDRKSSEGATAFVSKENGRIQAFVYVKEEDNEAVGDLPPEKRLKIGTLKVCSDFEGQRLGEGGIGLALWKWQRSDRNQIYLTVYPHHSELIGLIERFGFRQAGKKNEELVYVKDKRSIPSDDLERVGFRSFPYIDPDFKRGVYIPIKAAFHDNMFQYSNLHNTPQTTDPMPVANGITKSYIAAPHHMIDYRPGDVALVYRISETDAYHRSAVTTFCTVSTVEWFKKNGRILNGKSKEGFVKAVGNKTVYDEDELDSAFGKSNVCVITLIYNGYFGENNNVNFAWLKDHGLFNGHPYEIKLTPEQVLTVLKEGNVDESFATFNKS